MREIKFRAWNRNLAIPGSNEFMEYSDKTGLAKFFEIYPKQGIVLNGKAERFLMQSTGLKDKNGTEIYEGDFVKRLSENDEGGYKIGKEMYTAPVMYYEKSCAFVMRKGFNFKISSDLDLEVVGNIYENTELF